MNLKIEITRLIVLSLFTIGASPFILSQDLQYPEAKRVHQIDNYHGIEISDPYRWMEDVDTEEVKNWMKAQDETLHQFLDDENRNTLIKNSIERLNKTGDSYSVPIKGGDYYFYSIWNSNMRHSKIFYRKGLQGKPELLLDMNEELGEGESYNGFSVCPNGEFMVVRIRKGQDRFGQLKIYNVDKKEWYEEALEGTSSPNIAWTNNDAFYYLYYGETELLNSNETAPHSVIKFHRTNTSQLNDKIVLEAPKNNDEPITLYTIISSHDYKNIVIKTRQGRGDKNKLYLIDVESHDINPLVETADDMFNYVGSKGDRFFFYANNNAPNGKVIEISKNNPAKKYWKTIVPEQKETLAGGSTAGGNAMNFIGDKFTLLYREGTQSKICIFNLEGQLEHSIPVETGWIGSGLVGQADGEEAWYSLNTFLSPSNVMRIGLNT